MYINKAYLAALLTLMVLMAGCAVSSQTTTDSSSPSQGIVNEKTIGDLPSSLPISVPPSSPPPAGTIEYASDWEGLLESLPSPGSDWITVSFVQEIKDCISDISTICRTLALLSIPPQWTMSETNQRLGQGFGGSECWDYVIRDDQNKEILLIQPRCPGSEEVETPPPSSEYEVIGFLAEAANDDSDILQLRYKRADDVDAYGIFLASEMRSAPLEQYSPLSIYPSFPVPYQQGGEPSILSVRAQLLGDHQAQFADAIMSSMRATNLSSPN